MLLKRNLLTILYAVLFMGVFGIGFLEVSYLTLSNTDDQNVVACILVLGIIIYLIASFFIRESKRFQFLQESRPWLVVLEALTALVLIGGMFYLNMEKGIDNSILIVVLLVSIYVVARLQGGRLGGVSALVLGFFFILSVSGMAFDAGNYIDTLCFLVPYAAFLFITRVLVRTFSDQGFILTASYLALAVLFSLAILLNPLVCALLIGCVFSLVFGKPAKQESSRIASGPISAGIFVLFTALILLAATVFLPELYILPSFDIDGTLLGITGAKEMVEYLLSKYTYAVNYLYAPFQIGIFPAILLFLGCASGYYAIRKKSSSIGPLCLTYCIVLAYYLLCWEEGSHFFYMTYFLPVFAAYGLYSTLLPEQTDREQLEAVYDGETDIAPESEAEELPRETEEIPQQPENMTEKAAASDTPSAAPPADAPTDEQPKAEETGVERQNENKPKEEKPDRKKADKKKADKAKTAQKPVALSPLFTARADEEIPEWHIPENFTATPPEEKTAVPPADAQPVPPASESSVAGSSVAGSSVAEISQPETSLPEDAAPEASMLKPENVTAEEPVNDEALLDNRITVEKYNEESDIQVENVTENTMEEQGMQVVEPDSIDHITNTGENDMEQFLGEKQGEIRMDSLSPAANLPEEDDDSKLSSLLNRLDISDNIRRMNESAREDLADVIEREEESIELSSAIPTESIVLSDPVMDAPEQQEAFETVEPEILEPDANTLEPDTLKSDTLEPNTLEPNTLEPDTLTPAEEVVLKTGAPDPSTENILQPEDGLTWDIDAIMDTVHPVAEEPVVEEPIAAEPMPEKATLEKPILEKPMSEKTMPENPAVEKRQEPASDIDSEIGEYGRVPTINDLERKFRAESATGTQPEDLTGNSQGYVAESPTGYTAGNPADSLTGKEPDRRQSAGNGFAYSLEDVAAHTAGRREESTKQHVHSEEIVKRTKVGKRSYHKITIR